LQISVLLHQVIVLEVIHWLGFFPHFPPYQHHHNSSLADTAAINLLMKMSIMTVGENQMTVYENVNHCW
jgi:hypothetical protein